MKAISIERFGGPDVLQLIDLPTPQPGRGQIRIRIYSAGVNFAETLMRRDQYAMTPPLPSILGSEAAGVVDALGEDVVQFRVGQRVAVPMFAAGAFFGGYAEYTVIDAAWAVPLPDAVSFDVAVALMVQGLTALHLVRRTAPAGKTVLISAAAGGVGSLLIQLARRESANRIIAAASTPAKRSLALSLGADAAVDYTQAGWQQDCTPDVVYESVGGDITMQALGALAPGGNIVIFGALNIQQFQLGVPDLLGLIFKNQSVTGFALVPLLTPENTKADLGALFRLVAAGELMVKIGGTYALADAAKAHRAIETRGTTGKIVLHPAGRHS